MEKTEPASEIMFKWGVGGGGTVGRREVNWSQQPKVGRGVCGAAAIPVSEVSFFRTELRTRNLEQVMVFSRQVILSVDVDDKVHPCAK